MSASLNDLERLLVRIATEGTRHPTRPNLARVAPLRGFCRNGSIDRSQIDTLDGGLSHREILARYLLLNAVLDQGPDILGLRMLLTRVVNTLYRNGIRLLHSPDSFFENISLSVSTISTEHQWVKSACAHQWASRYGVSPGRYNLFLENSSQALGYAVMRWGPPLGLTRSREQTIGASIEYPLVEYLDSYPSAEIASHALKSHRTFGLGKAIGDKACHLFMKWYVSSFALTRNTLNPAWDAFSFEVPFDSNAGRVLWRTGFFLQLADEVEFVKAKVIKPGEGKNGSDYIWVSGIRGMHPSHSLDSRIIQNHHDVCRDHMKDSPRRVLLQRVPHAVLLENHQTHHFGIADLDEGLISIGTKYCLNHDHPECGICPINALCEGRQSNPRLISGFST